MSESEVAAVCKKRQLSLVGGENQKKKSDRGGYGGLVLCCDFCPRVADFRSVSFGGCFGVCCDFVGFDLVTHSSSYSDAIALLIMPAILSRSLTSVSDRAAVFHTSVSIRSTT